MKHSIFPQKGNFKLHFKTILLGLYMMCAAMCVCMVMYVCLFTLPMQTHPMMMIGQTNFYANDSVCGKKQPHGIGFYNEFKNL
jgi:hypothetical protein